MANDVEGEDLYLQHYFEFSEWTHSTISGLAKAECLDTPNIPEFIDKKVSNSAIVCAFQALFQTTRLTQNSI